MLEVGWSFILCYMFYLEGWSSRSSYFIGVALFCLWWFSCVLFLCMFAESLKHLLKRGDRNSTSSSSNITQKLRQISFRKSKWNTLASRIIEKLPNLMLTRNLQSEECTIQDLKYLWVWVEIYGTRQFPRIIRLKHELSPQDWLFYFVYDPMSPLWVRHDSPGFRYSVRWLGNLKRAVHNLYQVSNW